MDNQNNHYQSYSTPKPVSSRPDRRSDLRNTIFSIGILFTAPVIALLLTIFVFQSYQVDGPSMETTLQDRDRLIVWKFPRTLSAITGNDYIPNRGDIIIFNEPGLGGDVDSNGNKQLVKRVIALPGEEVEVKNGKLVVYNAEHPEGFIPDQTLPYGSELAIPDSIEENRWTVQENQLFVCGDNRPNSLDSRSFGPINSEQVVGKLVARILPLNNTKIF